jgi:PAS domain S-box-containing protein
VIGFVGCSHDVTERKNAEDELARSRADLEQRVQERTRALFELNCKLEEEVAERRRIAFELRESQERLKHLLLRSPGVLYSCEPFGDFPATFASDNAASVFGYPAQQFVQEPSFWVDHIHPDDRASVLEDAAKIAAAGSICLEYRFQHSDGSYRLLRDSAVAVRDESGKVVEIVGYCEDITGEKEAEQTRREQEKLRFLADTLFTTQESERRHFARATR